MARAISFLPLSPRAAARPRRRRARSMRAVALTLMLGGVGWWALDYARFHIGLVSAHQLLRESRPRAAAERLEAALRRSPNCAEAEYLIAVAYRRAEILPEVEPHLRRAEELGWDLKAIKRQRFLATFQAGDYRRAGPYLKRALAEGGTDDDAEETYEAMIRGYFAAMLFQEANFIVDYWCRWQPHNPRPYLLRAQGAMLIGDFPREVAVYREILRFDPTHYETRQRLGEALLVTHDFDEALKLFDALARERPDDATNLLGLADCLHRHGRLNEAETTIMAARRLALIDRQQAFLAALQGRMAMSTRAFKEAAIFFAEAVEREPANPENVYALSQCQRRCGRAADADQSLARYHELRDIDDRLDDVRADLVRRPDDANLRYQVGALLLEKDGHDLGGLNWLLSAIMRDPAHREAHRALAQYYRNAGQHELAERHSLVAQGANTLRRINGPRSDGLGATARDAPAN